MPEDDVIAELKAVDGYRLVLGATGKIQLLPARLATRAGPGKTVYAAARFASKHIDQFESQDNAPIWVYPVHPAQILALPEVRNVIQMAGSRFSASKDPSRSSAMNTFRPWRMAGALRRSRQASRFAPAPTDR